MAAGRTYTPISRIAVTSSVSILTFSSIPSTYTDLRLVLLTKGSSAGTLYFKINSTAGTAYSNTRINGDGTTASSERTSSYPRMDINGTDANERTNSLATVDFMSYSGTTLKTMLIRESHMETSLGYSHFSTGLWNNTSAISQIDLYIDGQNFVSGTTATLYGITAA